MYFRKVKTKIKNLIISSKGPFEIEIIFMFYINYYKSKGHFSDLGIKKVIICPDYCSNL